MNVSAYDALSSILDQSDPTAALIEYVGSGDMAKYFPEVQELVEFKTKAKSKDLWDHVLQVVRGVPSDNKVVRWAAMFHDVGKPATVHEENGEVSFNGHEVVGARLWNRIANRLNVEKDFKDKVFLLVKLHLRFSHLAGYPNVTDTAIRRLMREAGDQLENLYLLTIADITSTRVKKVVGNRQRCKELKDRIEQIVENDKKVVVKLPKGLGHRLRDILGLNGPMLGKMMNELTDKLHKGEIVMVDDFDYYVQEAEKIIVAERE